MACNTPEIRVDLTQLFFIGKKQIPGSGNALNRSTESLQIFSTTNDRSHLEHMHIGDG
jgi:hypothetical protein